MKLYYYSSMLFLRTLLMFVFVFSHSIIKDSFSNPYSNNSDEYIFKNAINKALNGNFKSLERFTESENTYSPDLIKESKYILGYNYLLSKRYSKAALTFAEYNAEFPNDSKYNEIALLIAEATSQYAPEDFICKILEQINLSTDNQSDFFKKFVKNKQYLFECLGGEKYNTKSSDLFSKDKLIKYVEKVFENKNIISDFNNANKTEKNKNIIASNQTKDPKQRPLASLSDTSVCYNATTTSGGKKVWNDRNDNFVGEARYRGLDCGIGKDTKTVIASKPKNTKPSISSAELEKERAKRLEEERKRKALEQRIAELEKKNKELQQPKKQQKAKPKSGSGSGFFISKLGHIITNQHVVNKCNKITIGDHIDKQVPAQLLETDRENDLALLRTTNIKMASAETQSLIRKLSIEIVPLASGGLMRKSDVKGGEDVIVAGFPYGVMFSKTIKVTKGIVSSTRGVGDDSGQFQIDAAVQPGNSGGPIYDRYGNIVGVVVAQLNKFKMAKSIGSLPENVNFGIKASTVSQFLNTSGVITNWAKRTKPVSNEKLFDIASKQTVMVVCHRD